ncbi:MAG: NAD(+) diphosphatase [Oscillospiraceae bacterium]|jgi:NAD+ diphosphatase|nr:NAD(+) diphosphatase [Oscillospiraceae bacterium]
MIQDILPRVYHVEYDTIASPHDGDFVLPFDGQNITALESGNTPRYIRYEELRNPQTPLRYLFSVDHNRYFLPTAKLSPEELPEGYIERPTFIFHMMPDRADAFVGITAHSLYLWYDARKFCGRCGAHTEHSQTERAIICPECGLVLYPQIAPVVIVAVTNGDKLLLTRYKNRGPGAYALIAGFVETGETLEDAVRREVMEEAGLRVKNLRYYKSQPWGFSSSLLNGFFCEVDGDDTITVDEIELSEALWLTADEIEQRDNGVALTAEMIERFRTDSVPEYHGLQ